MTKDQRGKLLSISSCTISDVLEEFGFCGETHGIMPLWEKCPKLVGEAVTVKVGPAGEAAKQTGDFYADVIDTANPGDVLVIDNHKRIDISCWDRHMSKVAEEKGLAGVAVDGAARDIDYFMKSELPVYARDVAVCGCYGKLMEYEINEKIQFCNRQVRPGDVLVGDHSGIVIIPKEILDEVIAKALTIEKA